MNNLELTIVGLIYLKVAYNYLLARDHGMALVFAAYAIGNIGFMLAKRVCVP